MNYMAAPAKLRFRPLNVRETARQLGVPPSRALEISKIVDASINAEGHNADQHKREQQRIMNSDRQPLRKVRSTIRRAG
jgi:hypothetical protein